MPSAEKAREQTSEPLVRLFEYFLETRSRLPIDPADRILERLERFREVRVLRIEIRLALGLLPKLVDRREIDSAEALDPSLELLERLVPRGERRVWRQLRYDLVELEVRLGELLGYGLCTNLHFAQLQSHLVRRLTQLVHGALESNPLLLCVTELSVDLLARRTRVGKIGLYAQTLVELPDQRLLVGGKRLGRRLDLATELALALLQVHELTLHARERSTRRLFRAATRFDANRDRLRCFTVLLRLRARRGHTLLKLATLPVRPLTFCDQLSPLRFRTVAPRTTLLDRPRERRMLGIEARDSAIEGPGASAHLLELRAARRELGFRLGLQLLALRRFGLSDPTRVFESVELCPRVGKSFGHVVDSSRRGAHGRLKSLDLVATGDYADLRVV